MLCPCRCLVGPTLEARFLASAKLHPALVPVQFLCVCQRRGYRPYNYRTGKPSEHRVTMSLRRSFRRGRTFWRFRRWHNGDCIFATLPNRGACIHGLYVEPSTVTSIRGSAQLAGSRLDPHRADIARLLGEDIWNAVVIFRELPAKGYTRRLWILRNYIRPKRTLCVRRRRCDLKRIVDVTGRCRRSAPSGSPSKRRPYGPYRPRTMTRPIGISSR